MVNADWKLATLTPEQEQLLKRDEPTLKDGILLALSKEQGQPIPPDVKRLKPSSLSTSQLECLQGLEQKLGTVLVAVTPS